MKQLLFLHARLWLLSRWYSVIVTGIDAYITRMQNM